MSSQLCRICFLIIKTQCSSASINNLNCGIIELLLSIKVEPFEHVALTICEHCMETVESFYHFREQSIESTSILTEYLSKRYNGESLENVRENLLQLKRNNSKAATALEMRKTKSSYPKINRSSTKQSELARVYSRTNESVQENVDSNVTSSEGNVEDLNSDVKVELNITQPTDSITSTNELDTGHEIKFESTKRDTETLDHPLDDVSVSDDEIAVTSNETPHVSSEDQNNDQLEPSYAVPSYQITNNKQYIKEKSSSVNQNQKNNVDLNRNCNDCNKRFATVRGYKYHRYHLHKDVNNIFVCKFKGCRRRDKLFSSSNFLEAHILKYHPSSKNTPNLVHESFSNDPSKHLQKLGDRKADTETFKIALNNASNDDIEVAYSETHVSSEDQNNDQLESPLTVPSYQNTNNKQYIEENSSENQNPQNIVDINNICCNDCNKLFTTERSYKYHRYRRHKDVNNIFVCKFKACRHRIFSSTHYLEVHILQKHPSNKNKPNLEQESISNKPSKHLLKLVDINADIETFNVAQNNVSDDETEVASKETLVSSEDKRNVQLQSPLALSSNQITNNKQYNEENSSSENQKNIVDVNNIRCNDCNKRFTTERSCKYHRYRRHNDVNNIFVCKFKACRHRIFSSTHSLEVHILQKHPSNINKPNFEQESFSNEPSKHFLKLVDMKADTETFNVAQNNVSDDETEVAFNETLVSSEDKRNVQLQSPLALSSNQITNNKQYIEENSSSENQNQKNIVDVNIISCYDCNKRFTTERSYKYHRYRRHEDVNNIFVCKFKACRHRIFLSTHSLEAHYLKKHPSNKNPLNFVDESLSNKPSKHLQKVGDRKVDTETFKVALNDVSNDDIEVASNETHVSSKDQNNDQLESPLNVPSYQITNNKQYIEENSSSENQNANNIKCNDCNKRFKSVRSYKYHRYHLHKDVNNIFVCKFKACDKIFSSSNFLEAHILKNHPSERGPSILVQRGNEKCVDCHLKFTSTSLYRRHRFYVHKDSNLFACQDCPNEVYDDAEKLKCHIQRHPPTIDVPETCPDCGEKFPNRRRYLNHRANDHYDKTAFQCQVCPKRAFKSALSFESHVQKHKIIETKTTCLDCNRGFFTKRLYLNHRLKIHKENVLHKCNQCPATFRTRESCLTHEKTFHANSNKTCVECNKTYPTNYSYSQHYLNVHKSRKICHICGVEYTWKSHFFSHLDDDVKGQVAPEKRHEVVDDKLATIYSFRCDQCPKMFKCNRDLR